MEYAGTTGSNSQTSPQDRRCIFKCIWDERGALSFIVYIGSVVKNHIHNQWFSKNHESDQIDARNQNLFYKQTNNSLCKARDIAGQASFLSTLYSLATGIWHTCGLTALLFSTCRLILFAKIGHRCFEITVLVRVCSKPVLPIDYTCVGGVQWRHKFLVCLRHTSFQHQIPSQQWNRG